MKSKLITGNSWFGGLSGRDGIGDISFERFRQIILKRIFNRFRISEGGYDNIYKPIPAFVDRGKWRVRCPECGNLEYAWEEGWFFCRYCKNSSLGHKYRRSVFPADRAKIEELLAVRPLLNRNWKSPEKVADLKRENLEHAAELLTAEEGG